MLIQYLNDPYSGVLSNGLLPLVIDYVCIATLDKMDEITSWANVALANSMQHVKSVTGQHQKTMKVSYIYIFLLL